MCCGRSGRAGNKNSGQEVVCAGCVNLPPCWCRPSIPGLMRRGAPPHIAAPVATCPALVCASCASSSRLPSLRRPTIPATNTIPTTTHTAAHTTPHTQRHTHGHPLAPRSRRGRVRPPHHLCGPPHPRHQRRPLRAAHLAGACHARPGPAHLPHALVSLDGGPVPECEWGPCHPGLPHPGWGHPGWGGVTHPGGPQDEELGVGGGEGIRTLQA